MVAGSIVGATLQTACLRTTVRSGLAPADPPLHWRGRWHHTFFLGTVESSGPVELDRVCPNGWSLLESYTDPLQTAITLLTVTIYTPSTVTVVCAQPPQPGAGSWTHRRRRWREAPLAPMLQPSPPPPL